MEQSIRVLQTNVRPWEVIFFTLISIAVFYGARGVRRARRDLAIIHKRNIDGYIRKSARHSVVNNTLTLVALMGIWSVGLWQLFTPPSVSSEIRLNIAYRSWISVVVTFVLALNSYLDERHRNDIIGTDKVAESVIAEEKAKESGSAEQGTAQRREDTG